ncbi:ABC transporter substrate-binding protein [Clostridium arbusti]|uniref:ABC transporter substrate-binding protein n=1 Tax=Clostridium arbusti TaxID=1137848 RepID=UPI00028871E7|nr:ABC transporter substrate-binding protein [Clostridium arbusti]
MKLSKIKTNILGLLLAFVLVLTSIGCSSKTASSENAANATNSSTASKTAVYTDMLGRKVTLTTNVKKVAILRTMDIYVMSAILGKELDSKLIAVGQSFKQTDIDGYKKYSEVYHNLDKMTNVGSIYDDAISLETMVKLNPDIIIVDKQFYGYSCVNKMIEVGLPVVFTDDNSDPFYGTGKSMKMLGKMLGKEKHVDEMVDYANKKTDSVLKTVAKLEASNVKKPKLYFECGNVSPSEIGVTRGDTSNGWGYIWQKLGADNIGVGNKNNSMNPEQVLTSNPDLIVIGGANWNPDGNIMRLGFFATQKSASEHLDLYTKRAGWSDLNAIKTGRLSAIHFNITVHPFAFAGIEEMAKILYPDEFANLNPEKDMQEFFKKYMPIKDSGTFWANWSK